ncbi:IS3 family transposase [Lysinibacillus xylanilyticus]|uniref:IS3 family transposase n=1 Tax=Lysinibacillus xylanilyticus TaxID=582475 RepID=A0ABV3W1L6_9BACI
MLNMTLNLNGLLQSKRIKTKLKGLIPVQYRTQSLQAS